MFALHHGYCKFAVHHGKSLAEVFISHLFNKRESEKRIYCVRKSWEKVLNFQSKNPEIILHYIY